MAMLKDAQTAFSKAKLLHVEMYQVVKRVETQLKKTGKLEDLADLVYAMQQTERFLEDTRKEVSATKALSEKLLCAVWATGNGDNVKTSHCTATPDVKMMARIPKKSKDPEAYEKLMRYLGATDESLSCEATRPHFPGLVEHVSARLSAGLPLPPGMEGSTEYARYTVRIHKRKEVSDE